LNMGRAVCKKPAILLSRKCKPSFYSESVDRGGREALE
jgi:hypothetical protein